MLRIANPHGDGEPESGADPCVSGRKQEVRFRGRSGEIYAWVDRRGAAAITRAGTERERAIARYLSKMTGLSRAQMARLIGEYGRSGRLKPAPTGGTQFPRHYTPTDVALLVKVDKPMAS